MDYNKFAKKIHSKFEGSLASDEIDALLGIEDSFNKDSPISTDKRLIIRSLTIIGNESSSESEFKIDYEEGLNILIADNLKGKSSVFKIIKYALTGRDSLKNDVESWIKFVFLNFSINKKSYAVFLDLTRTRLSAKLFYCKVEILEEVSTSEDKVVFEAKSKTSFEDQIQEFFFSQFSYYSLKWTQKDSSKSSTGLNESKASWATYFKSIFLESKDSHALMYGDQEKKVFEMLLGIELTYPINRLNVKRDMLKYKNTQTMEAQSIFSDSSESTKENLEREIQDVEERINKINNEDNTQQRITYLNGKFDNILLNIEKNNEESLQLYNEIESSNLKISSLIKNINFLTSSKKSIEAELSSSIKQKSSLEEFIQIGAFFSNLDIKCCPACDSSLTNLQKHESNVHHKCSLCHKDVSDKDIDISVYEDKIEDLNKLIDKLNKELLSIELKLTSTKQSLNIRKAQFSTLESKLQQLPDRSVMNNQLTQLENEISSLKINESQNSLKDNLISQRAVLKYRFEKIKNIEPAASENYDLKIQVINYAIKELYELRVEAGNKVTERLSSLMTQEVKTLGLGSVTKVLVNNNLDIKFEQSGEFISFNDLVEGEQLRAKLVFYLSLIQMDIEFNLGRHTRLLMIDSPAKEEGDNSYIEGLSQLLKSIETRFGSELQILIATAERDLEGIVTNQKVIPIGQYVF